MAAVAATVAATKETAAIDRPSTTSAMANAVASALKTKVKLKEEETLTRGEDGDQSEGGLPGRNKDIRA